VQNAAPFQEAASQPILVLASTKDNLPHNCSHLFCSKPAFSDVSDCSQFLTSKHISLFNEDRQRFVQCFFARFPAWDSSEA
jgi:alpha-beta hydrolase superfamily lysophospholipase